MRQIRVLVTGMPAFHADIVRRIVDEQADMSVVSDVDIRGPVGTVVEQVGADVMVVGAMSTDVRDGLLGLVWDHPPLRILALDDSGQRHAPIEIRLRASAGKTWPVVVVDAIRHAGEPGGNRGEPW
jgi:hypothetical protein